MENEHIIKDRILIVDDEKDIVKLLSKRLTAEGYYVYTAYNGNEALDNIKSLPPDLILLDIMMPSVDGMGVKTELNRNIDTMSIPVIFLTAKNETIDKVQGLKLGVDDYVTKPFNADELLARIKAILERRKFYEKISMTDALTGLYNVYFFKKQIGLFFGLARRYGKIFSIAILDIDNFKALNDSHGHSVGDFILRTCADIAKQTLRETDIITRYGGDEFVINMPESDNQGAVNAIERLQSNIDRKVFHCENSSIDISFSVSIGIATYNDSMTSEAHMFIQADDNLYKAKKHNR